MLSHIPKWLDPEPVHVPAVLQDVVGGHPLVAQMLIRRRVSTPEEAKGFLDPENYSPANPASLPGLATAAQAIHSAAQGNVPITIWGDFDADGQTATAVLLEALRALGADVDYYIPSRHEGHGLNSKLLDHVVKAGRRLIVTCDTGITSHAMISHANSLGARVIVTDHHQPGPTLPDALAIVSPQLLPKSHALSSLTGVGVAYQLASMLSPAMSHQSLDLVAVGMVADVATLRDDTRYLIQMGTRAMRSTDRAGLCAIIERAGLRKDAITTDHIGFVIAPRLNALARLGQQADGVALLTTKDESLAQALATELEGLNARRQWITKQVVEAAIGQIEEAPSLLTDYAILVLNHVAWPSGIIGIAASRLVRRLGKPTVLISSPEGKVARGSARSIPGISLTKAFEACASVLETYGGHAGAVGFSIKPENISSLRVLLSRAIESQVDWIPEHVCAIDAYVGIPDLSPQLAREVERLAPFGAGNPEPILAVRDVQVVSETLIGRMQEHRRLQFRDAEGNSQTVVWWHGASIPLPKGHFDLAVTIRSSDMRGKPGLQVEWVCARPHESSDVSVTSWSTLEISDYRECPHPEQCLREIVQNQSIPVWAEGLQIEGIDTCMRHELTAASRMVVWTLPPSHQIWNRVLCTVQPQEVLVFAVHPGLDQPRPFLKRLAGLLKYSLLHRDGLIRVEELSAKMGHCQPAVRAGLEWLASRGHAAIVDRNIHCWRMTTGSGDQDEEQADHAMAQLLLLLAEASAYRRYFASAPLAMLVPRSAPTC